MVSACLLNSHRWLHARLTEDAAGSPAVQWTADPNVAEIVIYLVPPWLDAEAPHRHLWMRPDLWPRLFLFSQADEPFLWAPGVFASASANHPEVARARGGFYVYPTHYSEPEFATLLQPRPHADSRYLWSFVGSVASYPAVRGPLLTLPDERALTRDTTKDTAEWNRRWQFEGPARVERSRVLNSYAEGLHQSKFVVCPRGVGLSSVRLFEAMRVGKCPVIVADDWLAPPFVEWESCSIRIAERDLHGLPAVLREREQDAAALGLRARAVWEQRYSPEAMLDTIVEACIDIAPAQRRLVPRLCMVGRTATSRFTARRLARKLKHGSRRALKNCACRFRRRIE